SVAIDRNTQSTTRPISGPVAPRTNRSALPLFGSIAVPSIAIFAFVFSIDPRRRLDRRDLIIFHLQSTRPRDRTQPSSAFVTTHDRTRRWHKPLRPAIELLQSVPRKYATRDSGEVRRAHRRKLCDLGPLDRQADDVGL